MTEDLRPHLIAAEVQRPNEIIAHAVDVSNVGSSPTSPTLTVYKVNKKAGTSEDVTASVVTGSTSVAGNIVTTAKVGSLTDGALYHKVLKFVLSGNTLEVYWEIFCTDRRP